MDMVDIGRRGHYVSGLLQLDVTEARRIMAASKAAGTRVSFTAWIIKGLATVAGEFPEVNSFRKGRSLYMFDSVNVGMPIEREMAGELVPLPYLMKSCESKSVLELTREIDEARGSGQRADMVIGNRRAAMAIRVMTHMPRPVRMLIFRTLLRRPVWKHKSMGAVSVTAVGMFGTSGGWPLIIPTGHSLAVAVGGISVKPVYAGDGAEPEPRQILDLTLMFNHDVIDGAPAARFSTRLIELMESADGL